MKTLIAVALLSLTACGGSVESAPCSTADAGFEDAGMIASPLGAPCAAEGYIRCLSGKAYACWPTEGTGELRWTGLESHWFSCG